MTARGDIRQTCSRCREAFWLLFNSVRGWVCSICWRALGYPAAAPVAPEVRQARMGKA